MKLYDFQGNPTTYPIPKIVFRGLDPHKLNEDGMTHLKKLFEKGHASSLVRMIEEEKFDAKEFPEPDYFGEKKRYERAIEISRKMIEKGRLDPKDISQEIINLHGNWEPTCFISTAHTLRDAVRYSDYITNPVLIFSTKELEGIDFRHSEICGNYEIAVFDKIPMKNLMSIIYFYENPGKIERLLKDFSRTDVDIKRGFVRPDFKYKTCSGDIRKSVPISLHQEKDYKQFYNSLQESIIGQFSPKTL